MHKVFITVRKAFVDSLAMLVFATVTSMAVEMLLLGMTFRQSAWARLIAVPVNLAAGRPYGWLRDWVLKKTKVENNGGLRKAFVDTATYAFWQPCQYAFVLTLAGASMDQIINACQLTVIFAVLAGGGYGLFLDAVRRLFQKRSSKTPV
jgi:hypothetical protein